MRCVWFAAGLVVAVVLGGGAFAKTVKHDAPAASNPLVSMVCRVCPEMVACPPGDFLMGSPTTEPHRGAEAQHTVTILRAFAVSKYEFTFAEWDACVKDGGCDGYRPEAPWGRGRRPVINVDFKNAAASDARLSRKTGKRY